MSTTPNEGEGTVVAKGNHVVPDGVAVEELDGGTKKLSKECPPKLKALLESNDLLFVYNDMVKAIVEEGKTRDVFGRWKDTEFVAILDYFKEDYATKGVKVCLCKRSSGGGTYRWLEFIDVDAAPTYVPQYDVSNLSGQVIKTIYCTLEFPYGVAVEEIKQYGKSRSRLKEKMPEAVEALIKKKDLQVEYDALVEDCVTAGVGKKMKNWKSDKLQAIVVAHRPNFEAKKVTIFLSTKKEWIQHGNSGHHEHFRWLEFVDQALQPNYHAQRDAETRKGDDGCVIS